MNNFHLNKLFRQMHWPWLFITLLVFGGLIKLGLWQNDRAEQKQQRLARITELNQQHAMSLDKVVSLNEQVGQDVNDMPVLLEGDFVDKYSFLLDNQPDRGRLGYRVYQIFNSGEHHVLVNLGWVPGFVDRQKLPQLSLIQGHFKVNGNVRKLEAGIVLMQQDLVSDQWPLRVQQIEIDKIADLISLPLLPFVVYLDKKESVGYTKNWVPVVMPPEKHRAYAFQWFSLALAWLVLMIWAALSTHKSNSLPESKPQDTHPKANL
jgi:surfeit locus 1 family protein